MQACDTFGENETSLVYLVYWNLFVIIEWLYFFCNQHIVRTCVHFFFALFWYKKTCCEVEFIKSDQNVWCSSVNGMTEEERVTYVNHQSSWNFSMSIGSSKWMKSVKSLDAMVTLTSSQSLKNIAFLIFKRS